MWKNFDYSLYIYIEEKKNTKWVKPFSLTRNKR